jgi:protein-disulfide isomerase
MYAETVSPQLEKEYVDTGKVRIVFRNWPIFPGTDSQYAAEATYCAQEQDKFWPYKDKLFEISGERQGVFSPDNLKKAAADVGMNAAAFATCFDSHKYTEQVNKDKQYGGQARRRSSSMAGHPA